ncbi:glucokinase [Pseudoxanthomonas sp.]|uniref:glucokinase n=1 Tax=Pseudoxanthomonas sp. TaxID=1871049 RepID=UPI0026352A82|nr:glucokinase [Pseudoxanthomonas sp.]WDS37253.1 MAG: glucokinase [Pseudoxanthomonas sp.]
MPVRVPTPVRGGRCEVTAQESYRVVDSTAPQFVGDLKGSSVGAFIAADVGGTFARLGLARGEQGMAEIVGQRRYACAEFPSLAAVLRRFGEELQAEGLGAPPVSAVVAIAGVLQGDILLNSNLPWAVSLPETRVGAGLDQLELINDFQALAWALPQVSQTQMTALHGPGIGLADLPALLLGPGTGLGAALLVSDPSGYRVLPSEAGHASLTAGNPLEMGILQGLQQQFAHVDAERILSGTGLMTLYRALCDRAGAAPRWQLPAELVAAADAGDDPLAQECLDVFCGWLGSFTGDLAITFCAKSVYLAGGIAGHITHYLARGGFMQRFLEKGVLAPALRQVPVFCIDHGWLGVIGAAAWHQANGLRFTAT